MGLIGYTIENPPSYGHFISQPFLNVNDCILIIIVGLNASEEQRKENVKS